MSEFRERFRAVRHAYGAFRQRIRQRQAHLGHVRRGVGRRLYKQTVRIAGEERTNAVVRSYRQARGQLRSFIHRYIDPDAWYYPYVKNSINVLLWLALLTGLYVFTLNYNFLYLTGEMPSVEELRNPKLNQSSEIYSLDGVPIGKFYAENRTPINYEDIPKQLINALIATEDVRFYDHGGVDMRSVGRAVVGVLTGRSNTGGGSTITQQLAKNLFKTRRQAQSGLLTRVPFIRTIIYKSKEWLMALKLERNFTKEEIITYYFNTVDFGKNAFGLKTAARTYFRKQPDSLNIQEGAVLVGLQKATTAYNPVKNPKRSKERRNVVLAQMAKYGYLTRQQADSISKLPLLVRYTPENPASGPASYLKNAVEDFVQKWAEQYNEENPGSEINLYTGGLKIYTTIDSRMQEYAEAATQEKMKQLQRTFDNHWGNRPPWTDEDGREIPGFIDSVAKRTERYKSLVRRFPNQPDSINYYMKVKKYKMRVFSWKSKTGYDSTQMTPFDSIEYYKHFLQAGMVAMDPHTGYIRAWVGGLDYDFFKYDHVKQGKRQPGSTFKPFVYTAAIDDTLINLSPCDRIQDRPFRKEFINSEGEEDVWEPRNSVGYYTYSNMTLRRALARSVNSITAQLTDRVTPERVVQYAKRMGIKSRLAPVPSIGLGSSDVSLYELVASYCTFVNNGQYTEPLIVQRIEDSDGKEIETFTPERRQAISPETAFLMIHMLKGGLQESGGTSQNLWSFNLFKNRHEMGGKTGTTSNNSDGWFVGVSDKLVVGAWVGGDDRSIHFRSTDLGEGAKTALPLVGSFLEKVYADSKFKNLQGPFPKPTVPITKEYLNCGYDPSEEEEKSDSTDTSSESIGDSLFIPAPPLPDPSASPDSTNT
ncbi:glycosyl transferase family 51 [Fibrisoma limi BUZ 3]|uniref:Glycosyl transferase family 51 n=1 Tax=Fibrisoma limi BUZ 3 TaxID=1185876 RepID=I2GNT1_9BACT|nr:transglycosylase domain-containing protein [Fibrisoma limi]CCH55559.1 glycosyl transferase family 51 [Fibrisoma limi BUZ 3]